MRCIHSSKRLIFCWLSIFLNASLSLAQAGLIEPTGDPMGFKFTSPTDSQGYPVMWDFGDGHVSTLENPTHSYAYPGRYVAKATVTVEGGEETYSVGVVEAGHVALFQDFETQPPEGWTYDPNAVVQSADAINGYFEWVTNIISPATNDSCVPPSHIPKDPPQKNTPLLDSTLYEGLVDLSDAILAEGSMLTFFWMDDPDSDAVITEARIRRQQGKTQIGLVAADSDGQHEQWMDLTTLFFRVEVQPWKAFPEDPDGGGARLRVLDPHHSTELGLLEMSGLSNQNAVWTTPVFGISRSQFPAGSSGTMRLDDLVVRTYRCIPPAAADLLGYWSFDDPQYLGKDLSGHDRHGTVFGGATGSGDALHLDGTGYLSVPSLSTNLNDQRRLTVEAWVRVEHHSQMNIFRSRQPLALHSDRYGVSNYTKGTGWDNITAVPAPPIGEWYHLAGVFNGGKLKIYVNGELRGEKTVPFEAAQGTWYTDWGIGARIPGGSSTADQFFSGAIDELKVYARALSASEIRAAANQCHP